MQYGSVPDYLVVCDQTMQLALQKDQTECVYNFLILEKGTFSDLHNFIMSNSIIILYYVC